MMGTVRPRAKYCPYCGSSELSTTRLGMPTCSGCRTVFAVIYSRKLRKAPAKKTPK